MISKLKLVLMSLAGFAASTQLALANDTPFPVPEPGTLSLVGLAIAAAVLVVRRKK